MILFNEKYLYLICISQKSENYIKPFYKPLVTDASD